jgi:hypothetical protein
MTSFSVVRLFLAFYFAFYSRAGCNGDHTDAAATIHRLAGSRFTCHQLARQLDPAGRRCGCNLFELHQTLLGRSLARCRRRRRLRVGLLLAAANVRRRAHQASPSRPQSLASLIGRRPAPRAASRRPEGCRARRTVHTPLNTTLISHGLRRRVLPVCQCCRQTREKSIPGKRN